MSHAIYEFELYKNDLNRKNSMKVECIFTNDTFIRIGIRSCDKDVQEICWIGIGEYACSTHTNLL
jgi:hypothetical protein